MSDKPLGQKAYGHIAHLPGSRMGPGDHMCHEGQARIATLKPRDKHDRIYVQEKLDGSCVSVAKIDGKLVPLGRAGYPALSSPYAQHRLFHEWAMDHEPDFNALLEEGERAVGEWLAQAHGTRYDLTTRSPFVLFDLMRGIKRATVIEVCARANDWDFETPKLIAEGPLSINDAMAALLPFGFYGALDLVEGAVWRVERHGEIDFLAKYVRPDKVDGSYLPRRGNGEDAVDGGEEVWNWQPEGSAAA